MNAVATEIDPDIVHGWMMHGNLAAFEICRHLARRPPCIWAIHQTLDDQTKERLLARLMMRISALLSGRPDALVYVSKVSRQQHEDRGFSDQRAVLIPNGIDLDRFRPDPALRRAVRSRLGIPHSARVVGHVGRFHPQKDYSTLLQALGKVMIGLDDVYAVIAGRDLVASNASLANMIPVDLPRHRLQLLGERRDINELMQAFDVLLLSSAFGEAFPTVLLESMAVGVPCVVTDVGDSAALVGATGRVVPARDPAAFATGVLELLSLSGAERGRLGMAALERVRVSYSIESVARQYSDVYASVLSGDATCAA
jgi:glycosyltransferase involved in cell wall biosynthesis